jgi:uncharacterized phage protein (TIGR02218 family)
MKILEENTLERLKSNDFHFIKCFKIRLKNQEVLAYNESSKNLLIDGLLYSATGGFNLGNIEQFNDISENNLSIIGFVDNENISEQDIVTGRFDGAEIDIFMLDLKNINGEKIYLSKGYFKEIRSVDNKFYVKIEGALSLLKKTIVETYSPTCRACFCDNRCKLNIDDYTLEGEIGDVYEKTSFFSQNLVNFEKNYFKYGIVTFADGGQRIEVKESKDGVIILNHTPYFNINVGDSFTIGGGCDKTIETCASRFNNNLNFRGEPNIPRTSKIYKFY